MSKPRITGKLALQLLEEVVAEKGEDYIYPDQYCVYVKEGQPACIVGHVFDRLGVLDRGWAADHTAVTGLFHDEAPVVATKKAIKVLDAAQNAQDGAGLGRSGRKTWGQALEEARRVK